MGGRALIGVAAAAALSVGGAAAVATARDAGPAPAAATSAAPATAAAGGVLARERFRVVLPADWRELPALLGAAAASDDDGDGDDERDAVERVGVGDPASGCYAILQVAEAETDGAPSVEALHAALAAELAAAGLAEVGPQSAADRAAVLGHMAPDPTAIVSGTRSTLPLRGLGIEGALDSELVVDLDAERAAVVSLACFDDRREPRWCRDRCEALRGSLEVTR